MPSAFPPPRPVALRRRTSAPRSPTLTVLLTAGAVLFAPRAFAAEAAPHAPPRLAVVISIDQGRADYLERFAPHFGAGGFRRLLAEGAHYTRCFYQHANTSTAVGHATISTGAYPSVHGIIANEWLDRPDGEPRAAVDDPAYPIIGDTDPHSGRSPRRLLATTLGEQLKQHYGDDARVCSVANKDRSAILMGGKRCDGAYWLADERFVSSRYYFPGGELPAWVKAFNRAHPVEAFFGRTWDRLLPAEVYDRVQGPDDAEGESDGLGLGRTFPRVINGGRETLSPMFDGAFARSPFALEIIGDFVRELVQHENLGADTIPDLLCIGFSQIDAIGHDYGPDSHEVMDSFLRLDRILAQLLAYLDERVGAGAYVVVLSADHGVAPLPERLRATRPELDSVRVDLREVDRLVNAALVDAFGPDPEGRRWCVRDGAGYRLHRVALQGRGISADEASAVIKAALRKHPRIEAAFTATELAEAPATGDGLATRFRHAHHPARSQDVVFALKPYCIGRLKAGSTHGGPHAYDRHVPLVWFGPGVPPGRHTEPVSVNDLAPTLAGLLGIKPPPEAAGRRLF